MNELIDSRASVLSPHSRLPDIELHSLTCSQPYFLFSWRREQFFDYYLLYSGKILMDLMHILYDEYGLLPLGRCFVTS